MINRPMYRKKECDSLVSTAIERQTATRKLRKLMYLVKKIFFFIARWSLNEFIA